jgi:hypothetical protein
MVVLLAVAMVEVQAVVIAVRAAAQVAVVAVANPIHMTLVVVALLALVGKSLFISNKKGNQNG